MAKKQTCNAFRKQSIFAFNAIPRRPAVLRNHSPFSKHSFGFPADNFSAGFLHFTPQIICATIFWKRQPYSSAAPVNTLVCTTLLSNNSVGYPHGCPPIQVPPDNPV